MSVSSRPGFYPGFYKDKTIQREVPLDRHRRKNVTFSRETANALRASGDETDLIARYLAADQQMEGQPHQVFLLSSPGDESTLVLPQEIHHTKRGAWTQGQRYTASDALKRGPTTTEELEAEGG